MTKEKIVATFIPADSVGIQMPLARPLARLDNVASGLAEMAIEPIKQTVLRHKDVSAFDIPECDNLEFEKQSKELIRATRAKARSQLLRIDDVAENMKSVDKIGVTTAVNGFIKEGDLASAESMLGRPLTSEEIANASVSLGGVNHDVVKYANAASDVAKDELKKYIAHIKGDIHNLKTLITTNPETQRYDSLIAILKSMETNLAKPEIETKIGMITPEMKGEIRDNIGKIKLRIDDSPPPSQSSIIRGIEHSPIHILSSPVPPLILSPSSSVDSSTDDMDTATYTESLAPTDLAPTEIDERHEKDEKHRYEFDTKEIANVRYIVREFGTDGAKATVEKGMTKSDKDNIEKTYDDLKLMGGAKIAKTKVREIAEYLAIHDKRMDDARSSELQFADDQRRREAGVRAFPPYGNPEAVAIDILPTVTTGEGIADLIAMKKSRGSDHSDTYCKNRLRILMGEIIDGNDSIALKQELKDLAKFALKRKIVTEEEYKQILYKFVFAP